MHLLNHYIADPMGGGTPFSEHDGEALLNGLAEHPTTRVFLARFNEEYVGMAICFWGYSTFDIKPLINIHDLIVSPDYREKGVAGKLLQEVERAARRRGAGRITLEVRSDNDKAKALYRNFGIKEKDDPMEFWVKSLEYKF